MSWAFYAFLSAVFAALTAILAKIGVRSVDSNVATAIRTVVILIFAWGIILVQGSYKQMFTIPRFTLLFLVLSGISTGLSWLFYFRALQLGEASRVAPIDKLSLVLTIIFAALILKEKLTVAVVVGTALITLGTLIITFFK
ncbi:EamA family transporter [Candidatus Roizmanbacteria bacterium]|nr:EamA family transporter [Candidatus Roizmanbacteria bacterium]